MGANSSAFVGSIPAHYDRALGPMFFEPYARELAGRIPWRPGIRVLELAAGTGIVTRQLAERLPSDGRMTVTDLNEPMLALAREKVDRPNVAFEIADACDLPFEDCAFDCVVCQFGLMFFPDKPRAMQEARRVLRQGGLFAFSVWDSLDQNPVPAAAHEEVMKAFPVDPPGFYRVPFGMSDRAELRSLVEAGGLRSLGLWELPLPCVSSTVALAVEGLLEGNPVAAEFAERGPELFEPAKRSLHETLQKRFGDNPMRASMQAILCEAERP